MVSQLTAFFSFFFYTMCTSLQSDRGNKRDKDKTQRQQRRSRYCKSCAGQAQCTPPTIPVSESTWTVWAKGYTMNDRLMTEVMRASENVTEMRKRKLIKINQIK